MPSTETGSTVKLFIERLWKIRESLLTAISQEAKLIHMDQPDFPAIASPGKENLSGRDLAARLKQLQDAGKWVYRMDVTGHAGYKIYWRDEPAGSAASGQSELSLSSS